MVVCAGAARQREVRDLDGAAHGRARVRAARGHHGAQAQDDHDGVRLPHGARLHPRHGRARRQRVRTPPPSPPPLYCVVSHHILPYTRSILILDIFNSRTSIMSVETYIEISAFIPEKLPYLISRNAS